jgi:APA family basic amino acid/polyamine antiporter
VPHHAELVVGVAVAAVVAVADLRSAIGFSSFAVLTYYGIANASAWTLPAPDRRWPRWLSGLGVIGCATLALTLPAASVLGRLAVLGLGMLVRLGRRYRSSTGR